jgi:hypothetical protein
MLFLALFAFRPEDGGYIFHRNVWLPASYIALQPEDNTQFFHCFFHIPEVRISVPEGQFYQSIFCLFLFILFTVYLETPSLTLAILRPITG